MDFFFKILSRIFYLWAEIFHFLLYFFECINHSQSLYIITSKSGFPIDLFPSFQSFGPVFWYAQGAKRHQTRDLRNTKKLSSKIKRKSQLSTS